jgi:hypothetical protein
MSSGILKPNYQNFPKIDLPINVLFKFDKSEGQKFKFQFISELISMLFKQKDGQDTFQNFSNLIALSLKEPAEKFADILFSGNNVIDFSKNNDKRAQYFSYKLDQKDKYLLMLNRIRSIFNNCPNLTNKQKFEYCAIERYFMKSYLKCL